MKKIRKQALLILSTAILPILFLILVSGFLINTNVFASDTSPQPMPTGMQAFTDLPSDIMYYPAIEIFQNQNIIIGSTVGGVPTAKLKPKNHLQRSEFTKVATMVHLLEAKKDEGILSKYLNIGLNDFTLKTDSLLRPYYTSRSGSPKFSDVPEKDLSCAMDAGGCEPWFTQYVNYMASLGTIKGTGNGLFSPADSIRRIHALKIIMVEDGSIPAYQDSKFKRIASDPRISNRQPRCLAGAEDYILNNNGGPGLQDSQNLLAYALLADKLDIFGNQCQAFTNKGISLSNKQNVAAYLQQPLTRQEIARYFALTTTIPELQLDPSTDPTVDTKNEYILPVSTVVKEEDDAIDALRDKTGKENTQPKLPASNYVEPEEVTQISTPPSPAVTIEGCYPIRIGRDNSKDMVRDCIKTLQRKGVSEDEIDRLLKEYGLWNLVKDTRESSIVVKTEIVVNQDLYSLLYSGYQKEIDAAKAWAETAKRIIANLNYHHFNEGYSLEETLLWGIGDKKKGEDKYNAVLTWYSQRRGISFWEAEKEFEKLKSLKIDRIYYASKDYNAMQFDPNFDLGPNPWRIVPKTKYESFIISKVGQFDSHKADPDRNTYIIAHGWSPGKNEDTGSWTADMANAILSSDSHAQILLIDWTQIANTPTPGIAARWLDSVTGITKSALVKWGINKDKTFIIGNSLGALFAQELSVKLGIVNVVGLDPAYYPIDYRVDFDGTHFKGFQNNGACLVADASWSGSEAQMKTCREGYLIDYSGNPDSPLFTELYEYVDFVIDKAVADTMEFVVDEGVTYSFDKLAKTRSGTRLPAVKLYRIVNGELVEVFIEEIESVACKTIDKAIFLPYICKYGIREIKDRFVTYHLNVPKTYETIITNPFYGGILSLKDIASRKNGNSPYKALEKGAHGIIYTERDNPYHIRYLKVQTYQNPGKVTLYGNTQANTFECPKKDEKECILYTDRGGDRIMQGTKQKNIVVKDFTNNNDKDKLFVDRGSTTLFFHNFKVTSENKNGVNGINLSSQYVVMDGGEEVVAEVRDTFLEGVTLNDVEGWVKDAKNEDGMLDSTDFDKLTIIIK